MGPTKVVSLISSCFVLVFFLAVCQAQSSDGIALSGVTDSGGDGMESGRPAAEEKAREEGMADLSGDELSAAAETEPARHVLARPWYQNLDISGFGAFGFLDTGPEGTRPQGGFLVKEATFFLEAQVWEDALFFFEVQTNRLGDDKTKFIRTGEVYVHLNKVLKRWGEDLLGIKIGRFDIPFGEEYLWQDAADNPMISFSAAYPYGWDEGILLYGKVGPLGWVAALSDGTDERSVEDDQAKALNGKIYADVWGPLYMSASIMKNGKAGKSAVEFGGSHFEPVGANHNSSAGTSPSTKVDATLYEVDVKINIGRNGDRGHLVFTLGGASQDDVGTIYDRDFSWFGIEPIFRLNPKFYLGGRYSEVGTYDGAAGYHFDGKTTAGGNKTFGYDTKRFRRLSAGIGWKPNPKITFKFEAGRDWFEVIDTSPLQPENDRRNLMGFEAVAKF